MDKCLNCGAEISTRYCPHCGQEKTIKRLEVKTIVHEVAHGIFHWDNSILSTFKLLLTKPGYFVKEYVNGRRKSFVKPFSFFLFFLTIYVLFFHWMSGRYFTFYNTSLNLSGSKLSKIKMMQHLVSANINYLYFIIPLVFAFFLKLLLKKNSGINYAESLVFSFYTFAMVLIFGTVIMLLSVIDIRIWNFRLVISFIYLSFAVMQFSGYSKVKGFVIGGAAVILSYIIYMISVMILMIGYLILFAHLK
ncbi:MAG: DUF3667 domain-containing protein [Candidatus Zixiibacteriota bacterium]